MQKNRQEWLEYYEEDMVVKKKHFLKLFFLILVILCLIATNIFLFYELLEERKYSTTLLNKIELKNQQISCRNEIIDKELGTNIANPLSSVEDTDMPNKKTSGFNIISENQSKELKVPLYTPDGHSFGFISYSAYKAIQYEKLDEYNCVDDTELHILHSYMNYVELSPGLSLVK